MHLYKLYHRLDKLMKDSYDLLNEGLIDNLAEKQRLRIIEKTKKLIDGKEKIKVNKKIESFKKQGLFSPLNSYVKRQNKKGLVLKGVDYRIYSVTGDSNYTKYEIMVLYKLADGKKFHQTIFYSVQFPLLNGNTEAINLVVKSARNDANKLYSAFKKEFDKRTR